MSIAVGTGKFRYRVIEGWPQLPAGWDLVEVAGVATDSRDRVYLFNRGEHQLIVFDASGQFVAAWPHKFRRPHGIYIGRDDSVYLTDEGDHTIQKFTTEGERVQVLGTSGKGSDTGIVENDYRTIKRGGGPFNRPTNLAIAPDGTLYITDGYGNARVHHFDASGKLLASWGGPGSGPGQFNLPHGIDIDREGRVFVADRENSRVQMFDPQGKFLTEWTDVGRPMQVFVDPEQNVFVAEVGFRAGLFPWQVAPAGNPPAARVSVFDGQGKLLARWGGGDNPCAPGDFFAPHDLWMDSRGSLYVGEVVMSAGGNRGQVPRTCHSIQKFVRE